MARGGISHDGIGKLIVTYEADDTLKAAVLAAGGSKTADGKAVAEKKAVTRVTGDYKAGFGSAGDPLLGIVETYDGDDMMSVVVRGYELAAGVSGSLPNVGDILVVDGNGAVTASAGAVGTARADAVFATATDGTGPVMVFIG